MHELLERASKRSIAAKNSPRRHASCSAGLPPAAAETAAFLVQVQSLGGNLPTNRQSR